MSHIRTVTISYEEYQELKEGDKEKQICTLKKNIDELFADYEYVLKRNSELKVENSRLRNHWLVRLLIKDKK